MQHCQDDIRSEGTVCWAWHTRVTLPVTMAPSLQAPSLQNLSLTGTSTIAPVHLPILTVMARQKQPVKIIKGLLTQSKYSWQDPYLALLAYHSAPVDAHMHSPSEVLYQHALQTTVPQHICHSDPHATADHDHLDKCASLRAANHDCQGCQQKTPLFAGQSVSVLNDARCLWLSATVMLCSRPWIIPHPSHWWWTIFTCACNHICERHPDATKPDKHIITSVAPATPKHLPATQAV